MVPRRALLRALSLSITAGLAGCNALDGDPVETGTQTTTPTATPSATLTPTNTDTTSTTTKPTGADSAADTNTDTPTVTPTTPRTESQTETPTPRVADSVGTPVLTHESEADISEFGRAVALSNDAAVVLAESHGAYVFENDDGDWSQTAVLTPDDDEDFGGHNLSAALVGDEAVLGGPEAGADDGTGAAYLFERVGDEWQQRHQFTSGEDTDEFGRAVAFDGDRVVVGDAHDPETMVPWIGDAYVFHGDGTNWTQETTLGRDAQDLFGTSVTLDGDTILIGAPYAEHDGEQTGAVYGYELLDGEWQRQMTLTPNDTTDDSRFGQSVAVEGDTAVVGAPGTGGGSAYVFEPVDGEWTQQASVTAMDENSGDNFGWSVAVTGETAVVGAPYGGPTGQAYVVRAEDNWTVTRRLTAADLPEDTEFGHSVALDDATALIGAPAFRASTHAYLFDL